MGFVYIGIAAFIFIVYIIGIITYCENQTTENVKIHNGGFLGLPYFTCTHRKLIPKDIRKGLIWPILGLIWFIKASITILNDILYVIILIFGVDYSKTRVYNYIDKKFDV